jgi:hypothetical protein
MSPLAVLVCVILQGQPTQANGAAGTDATKTDASKPADTGQTTPADLPVSLSRIQRALSAPSQLKVLEPDMRDGRPIYRVDIEGVKIDLQTLLSKENLRGPVPYGGMTHAEFLDMVTPTGVRGYSAFSNAQGITVAATSIALQWAVLKALDAFKKAKNAREEEAARKEVEDALDALKKARAAAGLPDK